MKSGLVERSASHYLFNGFFPCSIDNEWKGKESMLGVTETELVKEQELLQALKDSETKYALATQITNDGLWDWNLKSNQIYFSSRWKSMLGCQEQEIRNNPIEWLVRVHSKDIDKLKHNLLACRRGEISQFEMEYSLLHEDGEYRLMHCKCIAASDSDGSINRLIGSQADITERKKIEAQLSYEAEHDQLTNLPNRQLFIQKLKELSQVEQHPDCQFAVLCLDLDRFKNVNNNFGHSIGDRLLVEVVQKLQSCIRCQDIVARLGGDEFGILLVGFTHTSFPSEVACRIQQEFSLPIRVEDNSILITASIGIAFSHNNSKCQTKNAPCNLIESLQNAEIAMHQAKAQGKACNVIFERSLYLQNIEQSKSENDLRKAIEQEQFELHYQPIVKLVNHQLVGFEALIRWNHPVKGLISPANFIPLAENTGLIVPMGWWALRSACQQMATWQQENPDSDSLFISVNISSKQLSKPYGDHIIAQILEETGLNPRCLKLEITESEIMEKIDVVLDTVKKLKSLGVQLSMDDFGTGYSSLSYLHRLPVDTLKIDRSFVQNIESDRSKLELVKTIIKLAEVFDLDLIAEGIETEQQCAQLLELQCEYGQGYLFSQPVPQIMATTLIKVISQPETIINPVRSDDFYSSLHFFLHKDYVFM